jgi:hypothetical protein
MNSRASTKTHDQKIIEELYGLSRELERIKKSAMGRSTKWF